MKTPAWLVNRDMAGVGYTWERVFSVRAVVAVAARPSLWCTAAQAVLRLATPGWWHRWPPIPSPSPAYATFRIAAALGDRPGTHLRPDEVVAFLQWCRRMNKVSTDLS